MKTPSEWALHTALALALQQTVDDDKMLEVLEGIIANIQAEAVAFGRANPATEGK